MRSKAGQTQNACRIRQDMRLKISIYGAVTLASIVFGSTAKDLCNRWWISGIYSSAHIAPPAGQALYVDRVRIASAYAVPNGRRIATHECS